jgi:glycosyltransferase involved in cell wall biosynthesis
MSHILKFIELNYYYHGEFTTPADVITKHQPSNLFTRELKQYAEVILIKHLNHVGEYADAGIRYGFFKRTNSFWQIPFRTHQFIKKERPGIVLVQGFIFPLQVIFLRLRLGRQCKIILQHQAEPPFKKKKLFQKISDRFVDAYLFTSIDMAAEWIDAGVIKDLKKCHELPCASTLFIKKDKQQSRQQTGMDGDVNFLWVGRLNANKDPVTVLRGFEKYFQVNPAAKLYMIYHEDDLLETISYTIEGNNWLKKRVVLVGRIAYQELGTWYSAADYFVSGSRREGGSYALMEAMACGCIPIVTNIPAAMKTIDYGKAGYYYEAGKHEDLSGVLCQLDKEKQAGMISAVMAHFNAHLSPTAITRMLLRICDQLKPK